jgi:hypothetical protein
MIRNDALAGGRRAGLAVARRGGSSFIDGWHLKLTIRPDPVPSVEVPGLDERQVDDTLMRLKGHGLVDGKREEFGGLPSGRAFASPGVGSKFCVSGPNSTASTRPRVSAFS